MEKTEQIYTLIPKVMKDIGGVAKTRKNQQQNYAFRGIDDFYDASHPAMIAHGVFCAPQVKTRLEETFTRVNDTGKETQWFHVALEVDHVFYAPDGSSVHVITWGEGLDNSDKATNKAMSAAMKYALIELFQVPTKDVEDADLTTPELAGVRSPVPAPRSVPQTNVARNSPGPVDKPSPLVSAVAKMTRAPNLHPGADPGIAEEVVRATAYKRVSPNQIKRFFAIARGSGWDDAQLRQLVKQEHGIEHTDDIPAGKSYDALCDILQDGPGAYFSEGRS